MAQIATKTKWAIDTTGENPPAPGMKGYCVAGTCRQERPFANPQPVTMANSKPATVGTCSACGTTMFKLGRH